MRAYTTSTVAVALQVTPKWLDNTLSHFRVTGVSSGRQGVARRLDRRAVTVLEIALLMSSGIGAPMDQALAVAEEIVRSGGRVVTRRGLSIAIDLDQLEQKLTERLAEAVEFTPVPRRGRPAGRSKHSG